MHQAVQLEGGKLGAIQLGAEGCIGAANHRLCVSDSASGLRFLVDTGANISVLPRSKKTVSDNFKEVEYKLFAANGTQIKTYGVKTLMLDFKLRRIFRWTFVVADVSQPILGADFLRHFNLCVDLNARRLLDTANNVNTVAAVVSCVQLSVSTINGNHPFYDLLQRFSGITKPVCFKDTPKHAVYHHIETSGPPVHARARPLPPSRYKEVKEEFLIMQKLGICRPSKSAWASPLHVVPKKDGTLRPCGDYRRLNAVTKPDRYPIPRLQDFTYLLAGKKVFSKIDVNRAYHFIPVAEEDIEKTAIITPFGLFEFPRMTFGLRNAAQTFQRFMNHTVLRDLDFVFGYLDDVLIASENISQHRAHLEMLFSRLDEFGLTINLSKCCFGQAKVDFLGYEVTIDGIKPLQDKVKAIVDFPKPKTVEQLRRFLGMVNFYRSHLVNAIAYQAELNKYLINATKKDKTVIEWTPQADKAFAECKAKLLDAAMLSYPFDGAKMALMVDASDHFVGGVLQQNIDGHWKPLGYFSKQLTEAQRKYSAYDRELLAIYLAMIHFRNMFEGRQLTVFTDHKPLIYAFTKLGSDKETPRRTRQLLYISEFTTDIQHVSGDQNLVADALSRVESIDCPTRIDYREVARAQAKDAELAQVLQVAGSATRLKKISLPDCENELFCDLTTDRARPYLPLQFRKLAFDSVHMLSHPGVRASRALVTKSFYWPNMNVDAGRWAKTCVQCQRAKVHRHTSSELGQFPPAGRFEHLQVDIVGPLSTTAEGYRYIVTMIDRATGWPEAFPVADISAQSIAKIVYEGWIARFGCPAKLTSDQGRQFESSLFTQLMKYLGIAKIRTSAYHPQSNGGLERWHRCLKGALKARLTTASWADELPSVMLGLRAAPRNDTGVSAAELTYGQSLRLPGDFYDVTDKSIGDVSEFLDRLKQTISSLRPKPSIQRDSRTVFVHPDLKSCRKVFIRVDSVKKPLQPPYVGPYQVIQRSDKVFTVQLPDRKSQISIDRLKPAYTLSEEEQMPSTINNYEADWLDKRKELVAKSVSLAGSTGGRRRAGVDDSGVTHREPRTTRCGRVVRRPERY